MGLKDRLQQQRQGQEQEESPSSFEAEEGDPLILGSAKERQSRRKVSLPWLRGKRIALRPPKKKDAESILRWISNNPIINKIGLRLPITKEELSSWIVSLYQDKVLESVIYIIEQEDGLGIGIVGLFNFDHNARRGEYGLIIGDPGYVGRDYGHEATGLMLDLAFGQLNLNRIEAYALHDDDRAVNSLQKSGFNKEGELYEYTYLEGQYKNAILLSVLKNEYLEEGLSTDE